VVPESAQQPDEFFVPEDPCAGPVGDLHHNAPGDEQRGELLDVGALSPPARRDLALQPVAGDEPLHEPGDVAGVLEVVVVVEEVPAERRRWDLVADADQVEVIHPVTPVGLGEGSGTTRTWLIT
jgi:hypothetical protein